MVKHNYSSMTAQQALRAQGAAPEGLSPEEALRRLERCGPNKLSEGKKKPVWQVFLAQFQDLMVAILLAAAVISALSGSGESTLVIFAVLLLNALSPLTGLSLGLNLFNALVVGILGVPGLGLLLLVQWVLT